MIDMKGSENLQTIVLFLLPGVVFIWARSRLITGRVPALSEATIVYFAVTIAYWGLVWPILPRLQGPYQSLGSQAASWLTLIFVLPMAFGMLSGVASRFRWFQRLFGRFGLAPVHPAPSAWDTVFSSGVAGQVRIELEDGNFICGLFGPNSHASSDPSCLDIYLEQTFTLDDNGVPIPDGIHPGTYIPASRIRLIQIFN